MQAVFRNFIEALWDCADIGGLRDAMVTALPPLNMPSFAYLYISDARRTMPRLISNYPVAWTDFYLARRYQTIDPVILRSHKGDRAFEWGACGGDVVDLTPKQKRFFDEASQFGIYRGFTIPMRDRAGGTAAMTFAADRAGAGFARSTAAHAELLQHMAFCFHQRSLRLMLADRLINGVTLSPRECECLRWAAHGKSNWEIGCILGISRRTAVFHIENAKAKLGVHSIRQAVALFVARR